MSGRLDLTPRPEWQPAPRERREGEALPCKPSCCKSPYGHSTVRDGIPKWHKDACHCHEPKTETKDTEL